MTDPRVEAMYQAGVGARRPTPAQLAQMARMMRDLESIPDSNYNDLEASATEIAPDPELVRPYYGRRPGTRARMDGTPAMPGAEFASPEEAAEYTIMGTDPETGERTPSPHAQYMQDELNLAQVATVDGPAFMASGADLQPMNPDGTVNPHYLRRQQMLAPNPRLGGAPSWEADSSMMTPGGKNVEVMVPTQANRDRMAARNTLRQELDHIRRMQVYGRQANPDAKPEDLLQAASEVPSTQQERYAAQMRARAMARGAAEARRRELAMAQNAPEIRDLIRLRQQDPEAYSRMVADNYGPRNVQYRINPRTGQQEFVSERAYPPANRGPGTEVNITPLQEQMMADRRRETNPMAAGSEDVRSGDYDTPQAIAAIDALAGRFDDTIGGFSYENENALAAELVTTYGVPPEQAARLARRAALKRRRLPSFRPPGYVPPQTDASPPPLPQTLP